MYMPVSYTVRPEGGPQPNGVLYMTPPVEYQRYGYRGFRRGWDTAVATPERNDIAEIVCLAQASYAGGETFSLAFSVFDARGINGGGGPSVSSPTVTFEYDVTGGGVTPGNVQVDISGATTAAQVAAITAAAVQAAIGNFRAPAGVDPNSLDTVVWVARCGKVRLTASNIDLPQGADASSTSGNFDEVAPQPCGGRRGMIQYTLPAGGPAFPQLRGNPSLWNTNIT